MKKCSKCGQTYDDSWKVCLKCGVNLSDDLSAKESNSGLRSGSKVKKPEGVKILGIIFLILSVMSLLSIREGWKYNPPISNYLYVIITPLCIVVAVFLIKFKNWARIVMIAISAVILLETAISTPYVLTKAKEYAISGLDKSFFEGVEARRQESNPNAPKLTEKQIEEAMQKVMPIAEKAIMGIFMILIILSAIFYSFIIFYLSRPKVRKQFKPFPQ